MTESIRLHHIEKKSRVNGPGVRYVIWTQGCHFLCPSCFNPETHPISSSLVISPELIAKDIISNGDQIDGITISGGEPLLQIDALQELLIHVRQLPLLGIILFTGYDWPELLQLNGIDSFLANIDLVIAGRYHHAKRQANHLIGSSNKSIHFLTDRYHYSDLDISPSEVVISEDGNISISGIDPLSW